MAAGVVAGCGGGEGVFVGVGSSTGPGPGVTGGVGIAVGGPDAGADALRPSGAANIAVGAGAVVVGCTVGAITSNMVAHDAA